jgi:hypothetical protein
VGNPSFVNTVVVFSFVPDPRTLLRVFELVVDVASILDVADTVLLTHDTFAFVAVIVTHSLETLLPFTVVRRKFVTSGEKIEQEFLGQFQSIETTTVQ